MIYSVISDALDLLCLFVEYQNMPNSVSASAVVIDSCGFLSAKYREVYYFL